MPIRVDVLTCERCDAEFTISSEAQLRCRVKGWAEPRKCEPCRELFRHKPFRTIREQDFFGATVFRTYNSRGELIAESRDEKDFFGNDRRRHTGHLGKTTGFTTDEKTFFGRDYRQTVRPGDRTVKSESFEEKDFFGKPYSESRSDRGTVNKTTTEKTFFGKKFRETKKK